MTRSIRILLVAVVAVAAAGGYWKLLLAPKRAEAAKLSTQVSTREAELAQTQSVIAMYQGAQENYKTNYATLVRLGKAVPTDDDTRSLMLQLDTAAKRSGVDFDALNLNAGSGGATSTPAAAGQVVPGAINVGAFSAMPLQLSFTGEFGSLGNFLSRLESFVSVNGDQIDVKGRLLRVESLALQPAADGWPGIDAKIGASSYIVPETAAAAATPAPGSTTTPSTTTAAAPSSASGKNAG